MRSNEDKKRFLKTLVDYPWISIAARRVGIDHSTIYRWMNKSSKFAAAVEEARNIGFRNKCDFAEGKLNVLIQKEHIGAIKFLLEHNSARYAKSQSKELVPDDPGRVEKVVFEIVPGRSPTGTPANQEAFRVAASRLKRDQAQDK